MKSRYIRVLLCVDQLGNVILLNGSEDETVSSHVGRKYPGSRIERFINWLFNDPEHCKKSIEKEECRRCQSITMNLPE